MPQLEPYTEQQSRIHNSFSYGGTLCSVCCEACERIYFVTSPGHGDYEEGELERLLEFSRQNPEKYIEVPDFDSVSTITLPTSGKHVVVGCLCDPTRDLSVFIESNAEALTRYLKDYWRARRSEAATKEQKSFEALSSLGWSDMACAPKDATWVEVETAKGKVVRAHWASDLSGEDQPPFEGWFVMEQAGRFNQIHPVHWRPLQDEKEQKCSSPSKG